MNNDEKMNLLLAAYHNNVEYIVVFLRKCIDINSVKCANGDTLLHVAVKNKSIQVIDLLLKCNANTNTLNHFNELPLDIAIKNGSVKIVEMFLKRDTHLNQSLNEKESFLYTAVKFKRFEIVKRLCEYKANIEYRCIFGIEKGFTPFMLASKLGEVNIVKYLKHYGAVINAESATKTTALYHAVKENHIDIVKKLLEWGANTKFYNTSATEYGFTPLHVACKNGNEKMVELLLQNGVEINAKARHKKTPLHVAIEHQHFSVVEILLVGGANINALYNSARETELTALHMACKYKNIDIISTLLSEGININAKYFSRSSERGTALYVAILNLNPKSAELLLEKEAEVDYATVLSLSLDFRFTLLLIACQNGAERLVKLLLSNVVSENEPTNEWIPLRVFPVNVNNHVIYLARDQNNQEFYTCEQIRELIDIAIKNQHLSIYCYLKKYLDALKIVLKENNY